MNVNDINPFIRFAAKVNHGRSLGMVNVFDSRIFYVISGEGNIEIDGKTLRLSEGSLFYCPGGSCYRFSGACELYILNFDLFQNRSNIKKAIYPLTNDKSPIYSIEETVEDAQVLGSHIYIKDAYTIGEKIKKIISEHSTKASFYKENCSAMLKSAIIDIYRSESYIKSPVLNTIEKVCSYIRQNLAKKLTNSELSSLAGYHEYHLNRIFLQNTGKTVHQYIITERINTAKRMLATTDMTVSDIAESTGFNSTTHLCSCFKTIVGLSPSQYKKTKRLDIM